MILRHCLLPSCFARLSIGSERGRWSIRHVGFTGDGVPCERKAAAGDGNEGFEGKAGICLLGIGAGEGFFVFGSTVAVGIVGLARGGLLFQQSLQIRMIRPQRTSEPLMQGFDDPFSALAEIITR